ncbi:hypothetical protein MYSTI_02448 [Myxococcus stipitatus DSM 14675]|uniref:Lipoprotein n=1 Tax=Myxococcus stipitatus (strain DSM 14675 / JCM 12634 / Mx s8) TaxID=1278073 RepID=L7UBB8_MYXSD|nr:DUF6624 domain-containing protein [Myxococcus stipitatus]AGC43764.1 hypothetical protein MYSTI_02448 [Myxococcus stipitatus DSM 14675]
MRGRVVAGVCLATWSMYGLSGCASTAAVAPQPTPAPLTCDAALPGTEALLAPGGLVLLGEMHGTQEVPRFTGQVACLAAAKGMTVRVGLEIPEEEQVSLDAFLAAGDATRAQEELLLRPFWVRDIQDGRSSQAMLQLLAQLRDLRRAGAKLVVFAFDDELKGVAESRDSRMAKRIGAAVERLPGELTLVLTGNLHALVNKGAPWDPEFLPMGWHLSQAKHRVVAMNNSYTGGSAWVCMGQQPCMGRTLPRRDLGRRPSVEVSATSDKGYHGFFHVGSLTASPPAAESKRGPAGQGLLLRQQADAAFNAKQFAACAQHFAEAARVDPSQGASDSYNQACCHALAGDKDGAFSALGTVADKGYTSWQHIRRDSDLASLRADARWAPFVARVRANLVATMAPHSNTELFSLFLEDQEDREGERAGRELERAAIRPRDALRRGRVNELLKAGKVQSAKDYFHAGAILHHGEDTDFQRAHTLLLKSVELDPKDGLARMLTATAEDRVLMMQGKPQRYGTQRERANGQWRLYAVDPSVTDAERAKWGLPPLAQVLEEVKAANTTPP